MCAFKRGELPAKTDKDPPWRSAAVFTREEVERLISDERIPEHAAGCVWMEKVANTAPFCMVSAAGKQCFYYSRAECEQAAAMSDGACVAN